MIFLCVIYFDQNQPAFLAQMTSFVVWYDIIYYSFPINSHYLMTWGVDSPDFQTSKFFVFKYYMFWFYLTLQMNSIKSNYLIVTSITNKFNYKNNVLICYPVRYITFAANY